MLRWLSCTLPLARSGGRQRAQAPGPVSRSGVLPERPASAPRGRRPPGRRVPPSRDRRRVGRRPDMTHCASHTDALDMAVDTLQPAAPGGSAPDAGVIEDARRRQRRHRIKGLAGAFVVAADVGPIVFGASAGGDASGATLPAPGKTSGSLGSLAPASYQFWVTPDLSPGTASIDIAVQVPDGLMGRRTALPRSQCHCRGADPNYGRRQPLGLNGSTTEILFVASNVAAVRVGRFGIAAARSAPGLPLGAKVVAFTLPRNARAIPPREGPIRPPLTATATA